LGIVTASDRAHAPKFTSKILSSGAYGITIKKKTRFCSFMEVQTKNEFAKELDYSPNYLYGLLSAGRIPATKQDGVWLIASDELEKRRRLKANRRKGTRNVGK
jgi:hypothetical protein